MEETKTEEALHSFTVAEAKDLVDALNVVSELINEASVKFTNDGLQIKTMDRANVAMVLFKYKKEGFVEYNCPTEETFGLDLSQLLKILKRIDGKDKLTMEFKDMITMRSSKKKFTAPLLADLADKSQEPPALTFKATVKAKGKDISDAIEDAAVVGESISLVATKGRFAITAKGDLNSAETDVVQTELVVQDESEVVGRYAIEYLQKMIKGAKISDEVTMRFAKDYPLKMEFNKGNVELGIILAPRVDND